MEELVMALKIACDGEMFHLQSLTPAKFERR